MEGDTKKKYWFKRKLFGWGWYPASKEGWGVTILYVFLVLLFASSLDATSPTAEFMFMFVIPVALLTVTFIQIACRTGERPRWQWGTRKEDEE